MTVTEKRFTTHEDATREMTTQIFFGNQAYIRGQWPNGTGYTVVITKDDEPVGVHLCNCSGEDWGTAMDAYWTDGAR